MGELALVGDHSTVPLTRVSCNTVFSKSQKTCKAGTLCTSQGNAQMTSISLKMVEVLIEKACHFVSCSAWDNSWNPTQKMKTLLVFFQLSYKMFYKLFSLPEWGSFFNLFSTWNVNIQINEVYNISKHIFSTVNWNKVKHEHYLSCFISTEKVQNKIGPKPFWSRNISLNLANYCLRLLISSFEKKT